MLLTTTLATLPDERAALDPSGPCIDDDRLTLTNAEFRASVDATASMLRAGGVGAGDMVATMLTNRVELVVVMFAAWRIGAALTPINPSLTAGEAAFQIEDSSARVLFHEGPALDVPGVAMVDVAALPATPTGGGTVVETAPDKLALLVYTSGTTGKPKGVMLDHANLTAMVGMITEALGLTAGDRCLLILPLFHVNGILVSVLSPLAAGGCTSVTGRFSPSTFFDTVEAVRPTYFSAVPAIYAMLSALPDDVDPDTSSYASQFAALLRCPPSSSRGSRTSSMAIPRCSRPRWSGGNTPSSARNRCVRRPPQAGIGDSRCGSPRR